MPWRKYTKNELPNAPTREMNKSILGMAAAKSTKKEKKWPKKWLKYPVQQTF